MVTTDYECVKINVEEEFFFFFVMECARFIKRTMLPGVLIINVIYLVHYSTQHVHNTPWMVYKYVFNCIVMCVWLGAILIYHFCHKYFSPKVGSFPVGSVKSFMSLENLVDRYIEIIKLGNIRRYKNCHRKDHCSINIIIMYSYFLISFLKKFFQKKIQLPIIIYFQTN